MSLYFSVQTPEGGVSHISCQGKDLEARREWQPTQMQGEPPGYRVVSGVETAEEAAGVASAAADREGGALPFSRVPTDRAMDVEGQHTAEGSTGFAATAGEGAALSPFSLQNPLSSLLRARASRMQQQPLNPQDAGGVKSNALGLPVNTGGKPNQAQHIRMHASGCWLAESVCCSLFSARLCIASAAALCCAAAVSEEPRPLQGALDGQPPQR